MSGQRVGYVRISTFEQKAEKRLDNVVLDRILTDKASGKDTKHEQLEELINYVRGGEAIVVHSMDRLARNLDDLRRIVLSITKRGT